MGIERPVADENKEAFARARRRAFEKVDHRYMKGGINIDPVSKETYKKVFGRYVKPGDTILAVGIGSVDFSGDLNFQVSTLSSVCKENGATLILTDIDKKWILTHKDTKDIHGNEHTHIALANGTKLPFVADESLNGIASSNLINCPPMKPGETIRTQAEKLSHEWFRVLAPGGFVVVTSFGYNLIKENGKTKYNNDIKKEDIVGLSEIERLLLSVGFDEVREMQVDEFKVFRENRELGVDSTEHGGFIAFKAKK